MICRVLVAGAAGALSLALLVGIARAPATAAVTIHVDCTNTGSEDGTSAHPYNTIQEGIHAAGPGDTVLVQPCTYYENTNFLGKAITVTSTDPLDPAVVADTVIDGGGGGAGRVVTLDSGEGTDSVLQGFTITNGSGGNGGGIYCHFSSPTVTHNTITANIGSDGGGIYCHQSSAIITNNTISGNFAMTRGGGIYCSDSSPTITNNTISGNIIGPFGDGGGISCWNSSPAISNNIVAFNSSGIHQAGGAPTLRNNCVHNPDGYDYSGLGAGTGDIPADPLFVNAEGGDYHLTAPSPCIDVGWNDAPSLPSTDMDGVPRPWPPGGIVDIGADEVGGDTTPPVIWCPDPEYPAGEDCTFPCPAATATDDWDPSPTVMQMPPPGEPMPLGVTYIEVEACDLSGNCSRADCPIMVWDVTPPAITCPDDITVDNDPGQCQAVVHFSCTASDNCPGVSSCWCNPPSGAPFPIGESEGRCHATDAMGNTGECSFTVTVWDVEPPSITCPGDITVDNDAGQCGAVVDFSCTASDKCSSASCSCSPPSGSTFPVGTTTVTCTATDGAGNTATCSFTVTVRDAENPTIQCPPDVTAVSIDCQPIPVDIGAATASDNCAVTSLTNDAPAKFPADTTTTVTWTACDETGNCVSCMQIVTVRCLPPTCCFTYRQPGLTADPPDPEVHFQDCSTQEPPHTIVGWEWDFGDGWTSTEQDPTHAYGHSGCFEVALTVTNSIGLSDTYSKCVAVRSEAEVPLCEAGWHIIAQPHSGDHALADVLVRDDATGVSLPFCDAAGTWVQNPLFYYDTAGMQYLLCGCEGINPPTTEHTLRMGYGYWLYTFEDYLTLVFP